jgi:hypothetical protein
MKRVWKEQKDEIPEAARIIDRGLSKLEEYHSRANLVPAYVVAMGNHLLTIFTIMQLTSCSCYLPAINPAMKLEWYRKHEPESMQEAKELFVYQV